MSPFSCLAGQFTSPSRSDQQLMPCCLTRGTRAALDPHARVLLKSAKSGRAALRLMQYTVHTSSMRNLGHLRSVS